MSPHAPSRARGFTLIELLVALFITAIIFAMGYGAINQALQQRDALEARQDRLTAVETAVRLMMQDFTQLAARPVRDPLGQSSIPCVLALPAGQSLGAMGFAQAAPSTLGSSFGSSSSSPGAGGSGGESNANDLVAFTRTGWANPAGIQRPALERVSYRLEDGTLRRLHWPELDGTEATAPMRRDVLDHVKSVSFRFMGDSRQWSDQWPPLGVGGNYAWRMRPLAVEITLELEDWGKIVRLVEVPT